MKFLLISILSFITFLGHPTSNKSFSSLAVLTLTGAHIKARDYPIQTKYKRKDCPVCKGTGKYISGDSIKEVDCGYCEE